jgi:hypothetical protein
MCIGLHVKYQVFLSGKKGYTGPPGWGFGVGLTTPHSKKLIVTKVEQRKKLDRFKDDGESW